jgi:hypothetical protein
MHRARGLFRITLVLLGLAGATGAQETTGSIAGVVTDATGAVVPGVKITVQHTGTAASYSGATNQLGTYHLRSLPVGTYRLTAEAPGFRRFEASDIRVQVNEVSRVDVTMQVGQITESVEVQASVVTVNTEDATLRTVIDQRRVADLPLNGRNPTQLMRLVAGVALHIGADVTSGTTYPGVVPVSVNGARANATNYILDGGQNNDHYSNAPNPMPNPDALQEFSVQTNNFSAEFGRNLGGIVNAVTKSGTNELHGTGFWYLRHHRLNAANFFAPVDPSSPTKKLDDGLKRNQFGATLGGPVKIPGLYEGRDRTFFFFSYQGTRLRQRPTSRFVNVMTAKERSGDFSELPRPLTDPLGGVFPGNIIPPSRLFPGSKFFVDNYMPAPSSGRRVVVTQVLNLDDDQYLAKVDQHFGPNVRLSGRGYWSRAHQPGNLNRRNYYETTTIRDWRNTSAVANLQVVLRPTLINQTIFGYNNTEGPASQVYPEKNWKDLGVNITLDRFTQYHMTFQSISSINTGDTNNFIRDEYQVSNTTRWARGRHNIVFGGEYGYGVGDIVNNFRAQGQWSWANNAPFTGYDVADFMLGRFARFLQGVGEFKNTRFHIFNLFFNDSMKLSRRLTLDLGLRWEPFFPYTDVLGKLSTWAGLPAKSQRFVNAPPGVLYPGDPGLPKGGYDTGWRNLGPRLGLAWDLTGDGRSSLRLGYGIFFDRSNTISTNSQANQGPFGTVVEIFGNERNSMANPFADFAGGNPFRVVGFDAVGTEVLNPPRDVGFVLPHRAFVYARDMRNAYLQAWNLTLERQLAADWVVRASYAGSQGTALVSLRDLNAPFPNPAASTATTNQRRPLFPLYERITIVEPAGLSSYHALQLTTEKRMSRGFTVLANYTWAKSIDNNQNSANKATGETVTDPRNQRFDRGPADFDLRHVFNFSGIWELPLRFRHPAARRLLAGWTASSIVAWRSGPPFTVLSGQDNARTGTGGQRGDLVGNPNLPANRDHGALAEQYLSRSAFRVNALGTFGNLGRNTFRAPGSFVTDFGLHKDFPVRENLRLQFRFEVFNLFNNVNLGKPVSTVTDANFMRITSAEDPRILQFALRLQF